jgi:hypothetical protein
MALPTTTTKRLFTGTDVATGAVFSALGLLAFRPAVDPDVFWHLATGKWIWQNHAIPKADPFSWTTPGRAWIAHEWLTEAIWRVLYRAGGWGALVGCSGLILMATFALVRATARRLGAGPIASTLFTALSALAGLHTWNVRPQMISLAFCALFGYWFARAVAPVSPESSPTSFAADDNRSAGVLNTRSLPAGLGKGLWLIPIIMLAWVNLHGGWVFGMAMLAAFAVATTVEAFLARSGDEGRPAGLVGLVGIRKPLPTALLKTAAGVFLASLLLCFANPNGLKGVVYPFSYLGDNASTRYVEEWFAPSIAKVQYWPFFALFALFLFTLATGLRKLPLYVYSIGIPFSFLAVQSARNVSQFAVFAAPYVALAATNHWQSRAGSSIRSVSPPPISLASTDPISPAALVNPVTSSDTVLSFTKTKKQPANPSAISNINRVVLAAVVVACVVLGFANFTKRANLQAQAKIYPVAAVQKLLDDPGTALLNDYDWGGYLTHMAPTVPVSIDGRPDMYGDAFTDSYVAMWRGNKGWQARLAAFKADRVLAKPESVMATNLRKSPEWKITFEDNIAVLFARR